MNYDPMAALDMEKRLGIKNSEIDDFLTKADAVQAAIQGLKDGTLDPSKEIEIEGIETEKEKQAKADELARKKEDYLAREAKKKAKQKAEEKEKWWRGAELFRDVSPDLVNDDDNDLEDDDDKKKNKNEKEQTEDAKRAAMLLRYSNDYSRWEQPVVDDPATQAEQAELQAEKEAKENAEFEKNNPDFCGEFRADQLKRAAAAKDKESGANVLRLKGNRFFKAKKYSEAIEKYMASLKVQPYTVNTLNNIAIAHHKKCNYEDAIEFSNRAVYLDASHIKARCRRAASYRAVGNLEDALKDAEHAFSVATLNKSKLKERGILGKADNEAMKVADTELLEVSKLVEDIRGEITDVKIEKQVEADAIKALEKDKILEEKLKQTQKNNTSSVPPPPPPSSSSTSSTSSTTPGFKKVAIEMDSSDDDETKDNVEEENNQNQSNQSSMKTKPNNKNNKKSKTSSSTTPPVAPPSSIESDLSELESSMDSLFNLNSNENPFENMELPSQYKLIDELMTTVKDPNTKGIAKSGVPALDVLAILLKESKEARVYLRTSGSLMFLCCRLCGGGLAAPTPVSNVIGARPDGEGFDLDDMHDATETGRPHAQLDIDPARTMTVIAAALEDERRSKVMIRDQGVLKAAIELLLSDKKVYESLKEETKSASSSSSSRGGGGGGNNSLMSAKFMMESMADGADSTLVSTLLEQGYDQDAVNVASLSLISACIEGVGGDTYAQYIASNVTSLTAILSTLPSKPYTKSSSSSNNDVLQQGKIRQFALSASLFRVLCLIEPCRELIFKNSADPSSNKQSGPSLTESFRFYDKKTTSAAVVSTADEKPQTKNKKQPQQQQKEKSPDPVSVLACALQCTQLQLWSSNDSITMIQDSKCRQELLDAHESTSGALANLALHAAMRKRFTPAMLPLLEAAVTITNPNKTMKTEKNNKNNKKKNNQSSSLYLVFSKAEDDVLAQTSAFALAALMNVLISENDLKLLICENKGVYKLFQLIKNAKKRSQNVIRARAGGLLSRLAGLPQTVEEIRNETNLAIIANAISNNKTEAIKNKDPNLSDEREHLVRVLATAVSGKGCEQAVMQLHKSNTLSILASFLPNACKDAAGSVTATSVVMPSPDRVSFKLCGNVVRCFVAVMDNAMSEPAQQLMKEGLLERLVSLLANTQELAVRKNVAVVLAKAMRDGRAKERVRELRGMEMLVQLGPQL